MSEVEQKNQHKANIYNSYLDRVGFRRCIL